jgi:hypothetical protein
MTDYLIDLASYQDGIDLSRPAFAPWSRVNIKTSHGNWYVANHERSRAWADQARALGKGVMTFHWLDASTSGAEQARVAYREMRELGGPDGMAHQCDCEDDGKRGPVTYGLWRDYVTAMQDLLGRHIINYTGDWWWQPRGWDGASLTPYLMAAPNAGYLGGYPGDASPHWNAGYGGWGTLAAMQFRVAAVPNGGPGADSVSMTAIRDPQVWEALTGAGADMPLFDSHRVLPGPGHDAAGNLIPANVTQVGLPMSGSLWRDKTLYLSFKCDFGKAKLRYAVSYDNGSGKTEWTIGTLVVDSTKPRGGPVGAVVSVPAKADGVSLFREPLDATDTCQTPVALIVEIG